jgi:hypothetical protein
MFNNNDLPNDGIQFAMSHELIAFLRWLTENHPAELQELAKKALNSGMMAQLQEGVETMDDDETHATIIDFFTTLEIMMHDATTEHSSNQANETRLQQTIDQIDGAFCDDHTVQTSLEQAANNSARNPEKSPKELLFSELLKQWQPTNSQLMN